MSRTSVFLLSSVVLLFAGNARAFNQAHGTEFWAVQRVYTPNFGVAVVNPSPTRSANVVINSPTGILAAVVAPLDRRIFDLGSRTSGFVTFPDARTEMSSVRITSDIPIAAYQGDMWQSSARSDASLLVPRVQFGTEYLITGWIGLSEAEGYVLFHIAAVESGATNYSIVRQDGSIFESGSLDQWQVRRIEVNAVGSSMTPDPNGWRIVTDKPAAVYSGNDHSYVGTSTCCTDALEEQLWPVTALGTRYALSPLRAFPLAGGPRAVDAFQVIADQDGTVVTTTPPVGSGVLNHGERLSIVTSEPFVLEASLPVQVSKYQISYYATSVLGVATPAPNGGDPSLSTVPDVRGFADEASFTTVDGMGYNGLSIVSEVGGVLTLDGTTLPDPCEPVGVVDGRSWCHVLVEVGESAHRLTSTKPFWAELSCSLTLTQGSFLFPLVQGRVVAPTTECLAEPNHGACVNCCKDQGLDGKVCSRFCRNPPPPPGPQPEPQP